MSKAIKEIGMMLLVCLVGILLFAVVFYKYLPSGKIVPEVTQYSASEQVQEMMADDIDKRNEQVVKTFEVTSSDLNKYKYKKEYVPGKANPFATVTQEVETNATTNSTSGGNTTTNSTSGNSTNSSSGSTTTNENTNSLIEDKGTK